MLPQFEGHPVAWINPVIFRARAVLPLAGAWDATPLEINVAGANSLVLYFEYTPGIVHGAFDYQLFYTPWALDRVLPLQTWYSHSLETPAVVAISTDAHSHLQREFNVYGSLVAVATETFKTEPISLIGVERMYIRARESGQNLAAPGTVEIVGMLQEWSA